ncbi:glycosyltransferase family A protein [Aquamicrobium sp. LC103]|uniref:glycosyltransferase family 2 protein n=1 Tax=Aquamicrobium sp. LC103 TaxID=1120658 RepID=UPI00069B2A25|nr:glycosyltransferase family A protein [Aquamicrobium sp. LC103]TKT76161.1 glycosyltransferase family 2 protein [Aquamicrobium sp. LC103]
MLDKQRIDVLIPHYNDLEGLVLSLRSIHRQDWSGAIRVVIADDGSSQETRRGLHELAEGYPLEVTLLENPENKGRPYTRNVLLDAIESPLVAWLDAGDEWYPEKLSWQVSKLDEVCQSGDDFVWVTCNYDWKWTGARARKCAQKTEQDQVRALMVGRDLRAYLWTLLAPATAFKNVGWFDERLPRLQDLDFFLRFALSGGRIVSPDTRDPLCVYHKSDIGRDAAQIRECNAYIFEKYGAAYKGYGRKFCKARLYEMELLSTRFALKNRDIPKALYFLSRAFVTKPESLAKRVLTKGLRV